MVDEDKVREAFTAAFGRKPSPPKWKALVDGGYVHDIIRQGVIDGAAIDGLIEDYRAVSNSSGGGRGHIEEQEYELPANDYLILLSEAVAYALEREPLVENFRARYLSAGLVAWHSLDVWVKRKARADGPPTTYVEVASDTLGRLEPSGEVRRPPRLLEYAVPGGPPGSQGSLSSAIRRVATSRGRVLDRLRHVSEALSAQSSWPRAAATTFIVTGVPYLIPRARVTNYISVSSPDQNRIVLDLHPSMPPTEVLGLYRDQRREVGVPPKRLPKRPPEVIRRFVQDRLHERPDMTWQVLVSEWNRTHPGKWEYTHANNLIRDYNRAVKDWEGRSG